MEHIPGGAPLLAARDRAVAAVVHAFGRGLLDDASCAELLDGVQGAADVDAVESVVRRLAQRTASNRPMGVVDLASAVRLPADTRRVAAPDAGGRAPAPVDSRRATPARDFDATADGSVPRLDPAGTDPVDGGRARGAPGTRPLDAVDLALAARAAQSRRAGRTDPRLVSLALVVAVLIALLVLGMVLIGAVHGATPPGAAPVSSGGSAVPAPAGGTAAPAA